MKKVICYVAANNEVYGGNRSLLNLLNGLDRKKYEPIVLVPSRGPLEKELRKLHVKYLIWKVHENDDLKQYSKDIYKCMNFYKKNNVDLVHFNYSFYWRPAEILAACIFDIPIISHYRMRIFKKDHPPYLKYVDTIIANSKFTAKASKLPKDKTQVIYNSVDTAQFKKAKDLRKKLKIKKDAVIVSFISRLIKVKGIEVFINLANKIKEKNVQFLIAGSYEDKNYLKQIKNKVSNDNVKFLGYREDIENIYKTSDIIVFPTQWYDSFGRIVLEAGALGKPIITTDIGGIREIIKHGDNGLIFKKNDLKSLIRHTKKLIFDNKLRQKIGKNSKKVIENNFNAIKHAQNIEQIYGDLLEKRNQ